MRRMPRWTNERKWLVIETQRQPAAEAVGDTPEQQKIVQALSSADYYWRSLKRLAVVTGLEKDALDAALTQLLKKDIVKPAFGKRSIIFGLRERVDGK